MRRVVASRCVSQRLGAPSMRAAVLAPSLAPAAPHVVRRVTAPVGVTARWYADHTVKLGALAESLSEAEVGVIKVRVGDVVTLDQELMQMETDKAGAPVNSTRAGVVKAILVKTGDVVAVGGPLVVISDDATPAPAAGAATAATAAAAPKAPEPTKAKSAPPPPAAAAAAPVAAAAAPAKAAAPAAAPAKPTAPPAQAAPAPVVAAGGPRTESRVRLSKMRRVIAGRLKDAQNTYAMLTTFQECDMSALFSLREKYGEAFAKRHGGTKLGFMSAFIKAAATALKESPEVNGVIDGEDVVYRSFVDVSVAVASPKGLVVPVIRDADLKSFAQIERDLASLGAKAKDGTISVEEMTGGTFTISNGGVFGSLFGTPIINPPQSAILGMHGINKRPVVVGPKDDIEVRPIMVLALTYDHRLIDGREGVTFLRRIKQLVEDPSRIVLDV